MHLFSLPEDPQQSSDHVAPKSCHKSANIYWTHVNYICNIYHETQIQTLIMCNGKFSHQIHSSSLVLFYVKLHVWYHFYTNFFLAWYIDCLEYLIAIWLVKLFTHIILVGQIGQLPNYTTTDPISPLLVSNGCYLF